MEKVLAIIILAVFTLGLIIFAFSTGFQQVSGKGADIQDDIKVLGQVKKSIKFLSTPEALLSCERVKNDYIYNIEIRNVNVKTGESGKSVIIPVLYYLNTRTSTKEISVSEEEKSLILDFQLKSDRLPVIIKNKETSYRGELKLNQNLILDIFSIENSAMFQPRIAVPIAPDVKSGPCSTSLNIICKDGFERNVFEEGEEVFLTLCDRGVRIKLDKLKGSGSCSEKIPEFEIEVSKEPSEPEKEKQLVIGEDIALGFWRQTNDPELRDCWTKGLLDSSEKCLELLLAGITLTILPDNYKCP